MNEAIDNSAARQDDGNGEAGQPEDSTGAVDSTGGADEVAALRTALAQAEERLRAQHEQYLRGAAELDNVRKRAQRDIESAHRYALERFAGELLPVRDSLELAVRTGASGDLQSVLAGQEATLKLLERAFEKFSIRQIHPSGQRFDPAEHEAILMQPSAEAAPNTVLQVVQSGYQLNGRLLRPARVVVATAPAAPGQG